MLELEALSVTYPVGRRARLAALSDLSLKARAGQTLAIVGESGCGKSTAARAVAGLEEPSGGRVLLDNRPLAPAVERRSREERQWLRERSRHRNRSRRLLCGHHLQGWRAAC